MNIAESISSRLSLQERYVSAVISLLDDGATIPFISRYRKEKTGSMDETVIFKISVELETLREIEKRKKYIISAIEKSGEISDTLKEKIELATDINSLEDLYLPFKPKRSTKAEKAKAQGLEPLAKILMAQNCANIDTVASRYVNNEVKTASEAVNGALNIIAEWINEDQFVRRTARKTIYYSTSIKVSVIKDVEKEDNKYLNYANHSELLKKIPSHRFLAIMRGKEEGLLKINFESDDDRIIESIANRIIKKDASAEVVNLLKKAIIDCYKRLLRPSLENELLSLTKTRADEAAISVFADNLYQLLMSSPLGHKRVLAIDPGFRTGCKIVCLDASGKLLHNDVIYPTAPKNDIKGSAKRLSTLIESYRIEAIALGNGTASRETERFLKSVYLPKNIEIYVVDESGASIYSASAEARREFPDKDVTVRGAVSIGRRLIDPLSELVKIDPKSIGVGQYQYDVDQSKLKKSLDYTVENCVNTVGVNLNTASEKLLSFVSGIGPTLATNIVNYRNENGGFRNRQELLKVERFGNKAFEQSAGFLRIPESDNILDNTAVHPESYQIVERMAKDLGINLEKLISNEDLISKININDYLSETIGLPTLNDIINELKKPGRDPRKKAGVFAFDEKIRDISDLQCGMVLPAIITNITDFGAFADIGIHENGLIHISEMSSERRISHPSEIVKLHQKVEVKVISVDLDKKRISLSLKL